MVIGGYANGVGVVRALGTRGVPVAVVLTMPQDIAHLSRYASEHHRVSDLASDPETLLDLLDHQADRWRGRVLIPTNDHALEVLSRHRDRLEQSYMLPVPPWEVTRRVLDKRLTREVAAGAGLEQPRSYGRADRDNPKLDSIEFPVIIKPLAGHVFAERAGRKLLLARTRAELDSALETVPQVGVPCDLHELIPGPDDLHFDYQTYRTKSGAFVGDFTLRKLRQAPPFFGVARAAEPVNAPELRERSYELLRRLDWQGFASVCYKRDPRTGVPHLIEVNGRCVLVHGLGRRAGIDIPYMIYSGAVGDEPGGVEPNGWHGTWIHLHADLLYTAFHWRDEHLDWKAFLRSYRGPKTFAVWSARDPRPFLAQWARSARQALVPAERRRMLDRVQAPGRAWWSTPSPPSDARPGGVLGRV